MRMLLIGIALIAAAVAALPATGTAAPTDDADARTNRLEVDLTAVSPGEGRNEAPERDLYARNDVYSQSAVTTTSSRDLRADIERSARSKEPLRLMLFVDAAVTLENITLASSSVSEWGTDQIRTWTADVWEDGANRDSDAAGDATVAAVGEVLLMSVQTSGGRSFAIDTLTRSDGLLQVGEVDMSKIQDEGEDVQATATAEQVISRVREGLALRASVSARHIDILVLYTPRIEELAGNHNAVTAQAAAFVTDLNTTLSNSLLNLHARLVGPSMISWVEDALVDGPDRDLARLAEDPSDAATMVQAGGADLTVLFGDWPTLGGIADPHPGTFSLVDWGNRYSDTFSHEIGHNLGAGHNPENVKNPAEQGEWSDSKGYWNNSAPNGNFRTVMSYADPCGSAGCPRKKYFSNPDVNYNLAPTGVTNLYDNQRVVAWAGLLAEDYAAPIDFIDVNQGDYYYVPVGWMDTNDYDNGCTVTWYCVTQPPSRENFIISLWKSRGSLESNGYSEPFNDVGPGTSNPGTELTNAVKWAVSTGVTNGCGGNMFCPTATQTRAETVTFLHRSVGNPSVSGVSNPFTDVSSSDWFYAPVLWAMDTGITDGCSPTQFCPYNVVARGETAAFLYRSVFYP